MRVVNAPAMVCCLMRSCENETSGRRMSAMNAQNASDEALSAMNVAAFCAAFMSSTTRPTKA